MEVQQADQLMGQVIAGYRVEQLMSKGRLSAVYLGRELVQKQVVAITAFIIPDHFSVRARNRFIGRFNQEATLLADLEHPHILPTYGFGEQLGYPYLITPYTTKGSLAHALQREGRYNPVAALDLLTPVASGLDYAHERGMLHRALKPSNILLSGSETSVRIAGFGLVHMLELRSIGRSEHPYAHLLSMAGTFLGAPEYLAPEAVLGRSLDARADIYSLGIVLFELLTGRPPFSGPDPLAVALQHVQGALPTLQELAPGTPSALSQVLACALARDPERRFQSAGDFLSAYARVVGQSRRSSYVMPAVRPAQPADLRPPHTRVAPGSPMDGQWQLRPPIITGPVVAVPSSGYLPAPTTRQLPPTTPWYQQPLELKSERAYPTAAAPLSLVADDWLTEAQLPPPSASPPLSRLATDDADLDSFAWWSGGAPAAMSPRPAPAPAAPRMVVEPPASVNAPKQERLILPRSAYPDYDEEAGQFTRVRPSRGRGRQPKRHHRRQVVALLASGGLIATGLYFGAPLLSHALGGVLHPQGPANTPLAPAAPQATKATKPTQGQTPKKQPGGHQGTVLGPTSQPVNSAKQITNPADGRASLLIHLPGGAFAAYESACTHEGVTVNYDQTIHMLVCPAHGADFDPAKQGSVVQGPATRPLPAVTIRVNADGTVTKA